MVYLVRESHIKLKRLMAIVSAKLSTVGGEQPLSFFFLFSLSRFPIYHQRSLYEYEPTFVPYSIARPSSAVITVKDTVSIAIKSERSTRPSTIQMIVMSLETTATGTLSPNLQVVTKNNVG